MNNWNGKHPIPWDYFYSMQEGSGKKLDWFFYNWFYTSNFIDLSLDKAEKTSNCYTLSITNIGGFAIPFDAVLTYADGTTESVHQTPVVWEKNQKNISVSIKTTKEVKSITLDGGIFVDADMKNNTWTAN